MKASPSLKQDTRWVFLKKGTCSRTLLFILNRDFGYPLDDEERALDPVAGGILKQGYQCGMLWGAAMAAGAEAHRRCNGCGKTAALATRATQHIMESFAGRTGAHDCFDITSVDWTSKLDMTKYMISGKFIRCFQLADQWAPEAIKAAREGLDQAMDDLPEGCLNCASEVVSKMGGSEQEAVMVAGFAGGLGLSGNACGALSAAIWMKTLGWCRENPGKSGYSYPGNAQLLEKFLKLTDYEFLCSTIAGRNFDTVEDHSEYIREGGCGKLISALAEQT